MLFLMIGNEMSQQTDDLRKRGAELRQVVHDLRNVTSMQDHPQKVLSLIHDTLYLLDHTLVVVDDLQRRVEALESR